VQIGKVVAVRRRREMRFMQPGLRSRPPAHLDLRVGVLDDHIESAEALLSGFFRGMGLVDLL
jgi:hypothetical protein